MTTNNLVVLNDLPKFSGNPIPGDPKGMSSVDVRTFFRSLENHFAAHGISTDDQKIRILFGLVDKYHGDALRLARCFSGKTSSYQEIKESFFNAYPNFVASDFNQASTAALEALKNLRDSESTFDGLTRLETTTEAVVDAYLKKQALVAAGIRAKARLKNPEVVITINEEPPPTDPLETNPVEVHPLPFIRIS